MRGPSRLTELLLCAVMSPARAAACIGDIQEELAERDERGTLPRWPRLWAERQAWDVLILAASAALSRLLRTARLVVRDAWRALRAAPSSTAFILLVLTVAISAATVTFSVVDTVVLRDLPFEDARNLVVVAEADPSSTVGRIAAPQEYLAWRRVEAFSAIAAVRGWSHRVATGAGGHEIASALVTASLFDVLRVRPALGQVFTAAHETPGAEAVVVISHALWTRLFGGDPGIVGRTIPLSTRLQTGQEGAVSATVLGVMPEGFTYPIGRPTPVDLWAPYVFDESERSLSGGGLSRYLHVIARLRPGVGPELAEAQVLAAEHPVTEAFPVRDHDWRAGVVPLYDTLVGDVRGWMLMVLWAVALVLVIACVNVANLLLNQSARRVRELSLRASLGAGRRTLVATLITESLFLSLTASAVAVLVATWGVNAARAALPAGIARAAGISLDLRVLAVALTAAVGTGLFFGAVPAWQASRTDLAALLREGAVTVAGGRRRWPAVFLVTQVAFVGVLMVATTLFVSSFVRLVGADLGFSRANLVSVGQFRSTSPIADVAASLGAIPDVESVALARMGGLPLTGDGSATTTVTAADAASGARPTNAEVRAVSPGYFATARIPLLAGRDFGDPTDATVTPIVIDELAARALFGDGNPIGRRVDTRQATATVVGLVANVRLNGPEGVTGPQVYLTSTSMDGARILVRTTGAPERVVPAIRDRVAPFVEGGSQPSIVVLDEAFRRLTATRRFNVTLMSIFGALALFIGAAGVYAVMSSAVAQRTKEIGVRVALGATAGRVTRDVLVETGRYVVFGLAIGLPAGMATSRLFSALLFEMQPGEAFVYVIVTGLLLLIALGAALVPARRAARVDPLITLRTD